MDIDFFPRDDDFFNQALSDSLSLFKRKLFEILAQQLAKGLGVINDLLPVNGLLSGVGQLANLLLNLLPLGREFLTPRPELGQVDDLGLKGIQQALILALDPLAPLQQLRLLRLEQTEVLLFGFGPTLMQLHHRTRLMQQVRERLPDNLIEPIGAHLARSAFARPTTVERIVARAVVVQIFRLPALGRHPQANQAQAALAALDERPRAA